MSQYAAFLRGINVNNIRISMQDLRKCFENLGFRSVKTFLQSGNVIFESEKSSGQIKSLLEQKLSETFSYNAFVLVYNHELLQNIITKYPFDRSENFHAYAILVQDKNIQNELLEISEKFPEETNLVANGPEVIYWKTKKGESVSTAFAKILAKPKYKSTTTIRNINTLEKML